MMFRRLMLPAILVLFALSASIARAAEPPLVQAVLFFSPTCGHCEQVIHEDLPPLLRQYGSQLHIAGIDVTQEGGKQLYQSALAAYQVPDARLGVPALYIGDTMLLGSREIPEQLPGIIETALSGAGIGWSQIPGLEAALASGEYVTFEGQTPPVAGDNPAPAQEPDGPVWLTRFQVDPVGNGIAVAVLVGMIIVVVTSVYSFITAAPAEIEEEGNPSRVATTLSRTGWRRWAILVLALAGLGVATYMSYVEVSQRDAICGPIGDCNAVQKSPYAVLFGVLHVGVFGMIGYASIAVLQLIAWLGPATLRRITTLVVWVLAFFGLLFTIYLTFLEPFVIGATCIWCISSALIMTALFWATTKPAIEMMSE